MVVVAISGQPGCGSSTTGKLLAQKLKIKFFSLGSWNKQQLGIIEGRKTSSETQDSIEMWKNKKGSSSEFHENSDLMQKEMAAQGNVVIDAKLAIRMLKGFSNLSVWLKADLSVRAKRVAGRDNVSLMTAKKMLKEKEQFERENFKMFYGFDYFDQEDEADIVIDVANKTPEEIVGIIMKEVKKRKLV